MDHRPRPPVRVSQLVSESIFSLSNAPLFFRGISTAAQSPMRSNAMRARPPPQPPPTAPLQSISQFVLLLRPTVGTHSCPWSPSVATDRRGGRGRRWRRRQHVIMGGPGQAAAETTCRLPRPSSHSRTTSCLSSFLPLRTISRSRPIFPSSLARLAASASAMCVHLLPPWPGPPHPPFLSTPRFSNLPSGHARAATAAAAL